MQNNRLFDREMVDALARELNITDLENATIGQALLVASTLEQRTGTPFIRMDQGVPGLPPHPVGMAAEKAALDRGVASMYPPAEGVPLLKNESSRFIRAFLDLEVAPASCIPVVGSVEGSFGAFILATQLDPRKNTILFIDPGFPIQKSQLKMLGTPFESFDVFPHRGEPLREKLESYLSKGNIAGIIYSNPNNPAWICFTEEELRTIGELATKYDTLVLEDLAYFGMDFRRELGHPFQPPFQATAARYTDNYILMLSGSKIFSYAGQRIAVVAVGDQLFNRLYPSLAERYGGTGHLGSTLTNAILYMITSGATHSVQYALGEMFKAAVEGEIDFVADTREYARRAERMKRMFQQNGFHIVYDRDLDETVGDGFFFTTGYPGMRGGELMRELISYGISSISLKTTGSQQEGVRACTSRMGDERLYELLEERLRAFRADHP